MITIFNGYKVNTSDEIISDNKLDYRPTEFCQSQADINSSRIKDDKVFEYLTSVTEVIGYTVISGVVHFIYKDY